MSKTGINVGLDIGTTSIKIVVAEYINNEMNVLGVINSKSEGVSRGIIVDIDKVVKSIQYATRKLEEKIGIQIRTVSVGLPGNLLETQVCQGMIAVNTKSKDITDEDVYNVSSNSLIRSLSPERQVVALLPEEFIVDGFDGIKDPRGMIGVRLEMYGLLFTCPKTIVYSIRKCIEKAGLNIGEMVVNPLALTKTILSEGEKDLGAIVIDIGGGQTTTSVVHDKKLKFTHVEHEGGQFVTKDISTVLNTSYKNAEELKINYGFIHANTTSSGQNLSIDVDVIGKETPIKIDENYLSEIIEARIEQILKKVKEILDKIQGLELPGGIILTGGTAGLSGIKNLAQKIFGINVKVYIPKHIGVRNPLFSNVISTIDYSTNLGEIYRLAQNAATGKQIFSKQGVPNQQEKRNHFYDSTEPNLEIHDEDKEKLVPKIKKFFLNIFD